MNCTDIQELAPLYLSREMDEDRRASFDAHLLACRSCAAAIRQQASTDARLRDAFADPLPDSTLMERPVRARMARERSVAGMAIGTAAAAVLIASILGYRALRTEPVPRLYQDAALDHRLEVIDRQPRHWRTDPADISKLAARFELADVSALAPAGFRLEHAKMCGIDGQPALHLVYTNGSREFSVYVRRANGAGEGKVIRAVSVGSEHLAGFRGERLEAVIATTGSSGECLQLARFAEGAL